MSLLLNLNPTATPLSGGVAAAAGTGELWDVTVGGTWAAGDLATLVLTDGQTGVQTQAGAGNITGIAPAYCFTFNNKVYMLAAATAYFSELAAPTLWNDPNGQGNGFITMSNYLATSDPLTAIAPYQGRLLFTSRRFTQIWATDPDPANYAQVQVLANIGTISPQTLQPVGDMDVYMLADNGVRSVRVRDASDNAIIADIGTPIDAIIQPLLASLTDAQKAAACGVVEPSSNRYWCYIPTVSGAVGSLFVFSYFPSSGIAAWSTYTPSYETAVAAPGANYPNPATLTYNGLTIGATYVWTAGADEASFTCGTTTLIKGGTFTATAATATVTGTAVGALFTGTLTLVTPFVPTQFVVFEGQVWCRDTNGNIYQYGGANNNTYSACGVSATAPYLSADQPGTRKFFYGIEAAFEGNWSVLVSTDYDTGTYKTIYSNTDSSFQRGRIPLGRYGTHYSFDFEEYGTGYALFSGAAMHFNMCEEK